MADEGFLAIRVRMPYAAIADVLNDPMQVDEFAALISRHLTGDDNFYEEVSLGVEDDDE